ncbi:MAG: hypothetical protein R3B99_30985 [Polyangiales bacterium]
MYDVQNPGVVVAHRFEVRVTPDDLNTVNDETAISVRILANTTRLFFEYQCDNSIVTACPVRFEAGDVIRGVLTAGGDGANRVAHSSGGFEVAGSSACPRL